MHDTLVDEGTVDKQELSIFKVTDSPEEAVEYIREVAMGKFGLRHRAPRRRWFLGERNGSKREPGAIS
jgi:hypothetical protein